MVKQVLITTKQTQARENIKLTQPPKNKTNLKTILWKLLTFQFSETQGALRRHKETQGDTRNLKNP